MKRLHITISCLLVVLLCACNDTAPDYSEAEKGVVKATVARVQKRDSLDFYIGYYTQADDHYALAVAYNALGRNHRNQANYAEALDAHRKAVDYAVMAVDTPEIVQACNTWAPTTDGWASSRRLRCTTTKHWNTARSIATRAAMRQ